MSRFAQGCRVVHFLLAAAGEMVHTHTGANKTKLETFIRENSSQEEQASLPEELYPA